LLLLVLSDLIYQIELPIFQEYLEQLRILSNFRVMIN